MIREGVGDGAADLHVERLGAVDVLVDNAAVAPTVGNRHHIGDVDGDGWAQAWRTMIDVNLLGAVNVTWAMARHLIDRRSSSWSPTTCRTPPARSPPRGATGEW